jgi:hypothetical protein
LAEAAQDPAARLILADIALQWRRLGEQRIA